MSAITETAPGGEMVCILGFEARPRDLDGRPVAGSRRAFAIGEHVRYVKHIFANKPEDNPLGYMAIFEPLDSAGNDYYGAVQDYFVSLDCWEALKGHFAGNSTHFRSGYSERVSSTKALKGGVVMNRPLKQRRFGLRKFKSFTATHGNSLINKPGHKSKHGPRRKSAEK